MVSVSICVPTYKPLEEVQKQLDDIKATAVNNNDVFASCQTGSAALNRNYCLDKAKGEVIIMVDDDIQGFFLGWDELLISPLVMDKSVGIISARLMNKDGSPGMMMYDNFDYTPGYYSPRENFVPSACIAFKKTFVRFDENYVGAGFEDTDFCKQMELLLPEKKCFINNSCQLVHLNEQKNPNNVSLSVNKKYYLSKWGMVRRPKQQLMTIIYYTSNLEDPEFENKIIENLWKVKGELPIISVSQKPMEFGTNICVGDVGISYLNAFRQLLLGCEKATTPFVIMAESDCLYPAKGYFDFVPTDTKVIYSYSNNWIVMNKWDSFCRKEQTHGGMIYGREFLIDLLKKALKDLPMWSREQVHFKFFEDGQQFIEFSSEQPILNIITGVNGRRGTHLMKVEPQKSLPYWGSIESIKERMFK